MIIKRILVSNYLAIQNLEIGFSEEMNVLVGYNGCGKSTLLELIAGLTGTDEATGLVTGREIGLVELTIEDSGETFDFSHSGVLTDELIGAFKAKLDFRTNFPVSQYGRSFVDECIDIKEARQNIMALLTYERRQNPTFYDPHTGEVRLMLGDGHMSLIDIFFSESAVGCPMLMDGPEHHLDPHSIGNLLGSLDTKGHQTILATHSPQLLHESYHVIDMSRDQ